MSPQAAVSDAPWTLRLVPGVWFLLACALGALGPTQDLAWRLGAAVVGGLAAVLLAALWGPRTRPAVTWRWSLAAVAAFVAVVVGPAWAPTGLAAAAVAFYLVHDHPAGPGAILFLGTLAVLRQPDGTWSGADEAQAWWLAGAVAALVVAAVMERERLASRSGTPTAPVGSVVRVAWVGAWTAGVLLLRDALPLATWFQVLGLDVARTSGRVALLALLLLAIAAAGLLLRGRRRETGRA